ncbi:unnamed protein product [Protopolystoma xenopodis]|uniref:Uncharacterized protein n=1 Tax=Protopolystoma xenopodis TaxID=117903 RepID=A0A448X3Y6_9PLAT|nr:unnamed protein product [Protopolystoma xenopodis]
MVYAYTKPRGPIAAMYNSPGPVYLLPPLLGSSSHSHKHDPRSTHPTAPSWTLGSRLAASQTTGGEGPGPVYSVPGGLTRYGDASEHRATSIFSRPPEIKPLETPGPNAYNIDPASKLVFSMTPAFSCSGRLDGRTSDEVPRE